MENTVARKIVHEPMYNSNLTTMRFQLFVYYCDYDYYFNLVFGWINVWYRRFNAIHKIRLSCRPAVIEREPILLYSNIFDNPMTKFPNRDFSISVEKNDFQCAMT